MLVCLPLWGRARRKGDRMYGDRIRVAREARGWTPAQLASKVSTTADLIRRYERDITNPPLPMLDRIATALGMLIGDLLPNSANGPDAVSLAPIAAELDPLPRADVPEIVVNLAAQARCLVSWRLRTPLASFPPLARHAAPDDEPGERPGTAPPTARDRR